MITARPVTTDPRGVSFLELVLPKEHGSWSLALEPLLLGLCVAPSVPGALLAGAAAAAFFARRPLQRLARGERGERRAAAVRALGVLGLIAALGFGGAVALAGTAWLVFLLPATLAGLVFLVFDWRGGGREGIAEAAGAAAFGTLPAALAALGGLDAWGAGALGVAMLGRAVPTVLVVRAYLRGQKTGTWQVAPALVASALAIAAAFPLVRAGHAPSVMLGLLGLLAARAAFLLLAPRPKFRARSIGMVEAIAGLVFVIGLAVAWGR